MIKTDTKVVRALLVGVEVWLGDDLSGSGSGRE